MAKGFVVAEIEESTGTPTGFWNGSVFVELESAVFYSNKPDSKYAFGYAQSGYPEKDVSILPATLELRLEQEILKQSPLQTTVRVNAAE
ncbi:hypothetical protein [Argonema antarcticum]|uniref:hypothetical protein n=1 Tax=Argonema antarcticum TaxID=2942763 RepID=UPI0020118C15|nr:hypothetical protein [Argonema antarcticum]MCL1474422.1 hypothetical protein [Argonema antarcticum A004/B2]